MRQVVAAGGEVPVSREIVTHYIEPVPARGIDAAILATCARLWMRGLLALGQTLDYPALDLEVDVRWYRLIGPRSMRFAIDVSNIELLAFYTR